MFNFSLIIFLYLGNFYIFAKCTSISLNFPLIHKKLKISLFENKPYKSKENINFLKNKYSNSKRNLTPKKNLILTSIINYN